MNKGYQKAIRRESQLCELRSLGGLRARLALEGASTSHIHDENGAELLCTILFVQRIRKLPGRPQPGQSLRARARGSPG